MSVNIHIFVAPFDPENRICISEPAILRVNRSKKYKSA